MATATTSLTITLTALSTALGVNVVISPPVTPNASAPGTLSTSVALVNGDNTISVPTGALGMLIVPSTGAALKKLKGAGGDTGVNIAPTNPTFLGLSSGTVSIIMNANASETITVYWF